MRVGVYSFPKAGSTWLRVILSRLYDTKHEVPQFCPDMHWNKQQIIDVPFAGVNKTRKSTTFYKSHSKTLVNRYFDLDLPTTHVLYIYRNPLDIFCSYLNYLLRDPTASKGSFAFPDNKYPKSVESSKENGFLDLAFSSFLLFGTLQPNFDICGSWLDHYRLWIKGNYDVKIHLISYE